MTTAIAGKNDNSHLLDGWPKVLAVLLIFQMRFWSVDNSFPSGAPWMWVVGGGGGQSVQLEQVLPGVDPFLVS